MELYVSRGQPDATTLVFPDSEGGHLRGRTGVGAYGSRHSRVPAFPYFRSYDLRHTCATLLLYEGRTLNEVAEHLGHADPGFTARTYAHVMRDTTRSVAFRSRPGDPHGTSRRFP